ncbi:hypothetical protein [Nocardia sp. NPDC050710]|uniref:hypothetical protein n=1 Tax=Nocardia sp. NPDC050710 TaxID=3157220 RepID=UPI0033C7E476
MSGLICQYCSHRNSSADPRCNHCGAPLVKALEKAVELGTAVATGGAATVASAVAGVEAIESAAKGAENPSGGKAPIWQWRAVGMIIVVLSVLGIVVARSCALHLPSVAEVSGAQVLPERLRTAASCQRMDPVQEVDKCVIAGNDPMLWGGITAGRELTFYFQVSASDRLTETIARWRAAGGVIVTDSWVFAAVGPSATVLYANTRTGLRIETGTFAGVSGAQTFLTRSGLTR